MISNKKTALIIGAGPAGLTAAYELLAHTDVQPIIIEQSHFLGGLARTEKHKGNRMDIGPHRFFSKSDRVMNWWLSILPLASGTEPATIFYQGKQRLVSESSNAATGDDTMLLRPRTTRIYYQGKFFDYPISLSWQTIRNLGILETFLVGLSYIKRAVNPRRPEVTLEDFYINRFGQRLYQKFFKSYTEKVWGVACKDIPASWGAQRVKGVSIRKTIVHALKKFFKLGSVSKVETSLVEQFLYPKFGAGHMWETVAKKITGRGGQILLGWKVESLNWQDEKIISIDCQNELGEVKNFVADYFFSSMPISELVGNLQPAAPPEVAKIAQELPYRDLVIVALEVKKFSDKSGRPIDLPDNWIYLQDAGIRAGRLQISNNMSPWLGANQGNYWIGLEYFCNRGDEIITKTDEALIDLGKTELQAIGLISASDVVDGAVFRAPQAYPAYFGSYLKFPELRKYLDTFDNLYLLGRNGQHRYNNQDHSMLTAMIAVDNIKEGRLSKDNIWSVNTEEDYHESAKSTET